MTTYFHGWKRKIGIGLLGLTCVFEVGWMRSYSVTDRIQFEDGGTYKTPTWSLESMDGAVVYVYRYTEYGVETNWCEVQSVPSRDTLKSRLSAGMVSEYAEPLRWVWNFYGFGSAKIEAEFQLHEAHFAPYWAIVTPLALISAWCLLTKPRHEGRITLCDMQIELYERAAKAIAELEGGPHGPSAEDKAESIQRILAVIEKLRKDREPALSRSIMFTNGRRVFSKQ
jgi:hypothetical protein